MSDLIDRQAAIDGKICIQRSNGVEIYDDYAVPVEYLEQLPPAQLGTNLSEVGTDCISRQEAIDALRKLREEDIEDYGCEIPEGFNQDHLDRATFAIKQLPPIQPKRGRWIKLDMHRGMADHKCTACKQECYVPTCMGEPMYAYCPNCGAKMEVTT